MLASEYPVPRQAAYIWLVGDTVYLGLPSLHGEKGHTVTLPATVPGLLTLLALLQERSRNRKAFIGERADPTQHQVEAMLKEIRRAGEVRHQQTKAEAAETDALLAELGL